MGNYTARPMNEEYLRSFTVEVRECEEQHACLVEMEFHPTGQKGVLCFHLTAVGPIPDVALLAKIASIAATYPSASNATLEGFLMGLMMKLARMVAQFRSSEETRAAESRG